MPGYADPELLICGWLQPRLGCKLWADPRLPADWSFTAPLGHVQRGQGDADRVVGLDAVLLDVDFYDRSADRARSVADWCRTQMRMHLPGCQFDSGILVTAVETVTAPFWAPDPEVFRRSATYRAYLAGVLP